jgi:hypothetical protein
MEEFFFRAVERVAFPIAVSMLSFWAVYKLFVLREKERLAREDRLSIAIDKNTVAMEEQTSEIKKRFDSDALRKTRQELVMEIASKFQCKAAEAELLLKEHERRRHRDGR